MTSEDQALFLLGKLMGGTDLFLDECKKFQNCQDLDMGGLHGIAIRIPPGIRGKSWHDAHNGLLKIIQEIKQIYKMPEDGRDCND